MSKTPHPPAPQRIQFRKGHRMQSSNGLACVYVGRPTPWGNPYRVGAANTLTRAEAVQAIRALILARPRLMEAVRRELKGKNLAC